MCVIVYKPKGADFPSKETLQQCWTKNDDGAGFMFPYKNRVEIRKGFMTFDDFYNALQETIRLQGKRKAYVMHFRITTQGGVQAKLTHPYPLSKNMEDLKELTFSSDIGVAHNGIISLTSSSYNKDHNDTMEFITDYLSLLIKNRNFYKSEDTLKLIKKLCKSKLCILDGSGHTQLVGDFIQGEDGCYYSNESFKNYTPKTYTYTCSYGSPKTTTKSEPIVINGNSKLSDYKQGIKDNICKYKRNGIYYFIGDKFCPKTTLNDCSYCGACAFAEKCGHKPNRKGE